MAELVAAQLLDSIAAAVMVAGCLKRVLLVELIDAVFLIVYFEFVGFDFVLFVELVIVVAVAVAVEIFVIWVDDVEFVVENSEIAVATVAEAVAVVVVFEFVADFVAIVVIVERVVKLLVEKYVALFVDEIELVAEIVVFVVVVE